MTLLGLKASILQGINRVRQKGGWLISFPHQVWRELYWKLSSHLGMTLSLFPSHLLVFLPLQSHLSDAGPCSFSLLRTPSCAVCWTFPTHFSVYYHCVWSHWQLSLTIKQTKPQRVNGQLMKVWLILTVTIDSKACGVLSGKYEQWCVEGQPVIGKDKLGDMGKWAGRRLILSSYDWDPSEYKEFVSTTCHWIPEENLKDVGESNQWQTGTVL